jgi:hypothetical protein
MFRVVRAAEVPDGVLARFAGLVASRSRIVLMQVRLLLLV